MKHMIWCLLLLLILGLSCKDEPTKPAEYALFSVQAEDVSCTEVYLKVHLGAGYNTRTVKIMRDTVIVMNRMMSETDLMVIDTNLSPNRTYSYTAHLLDGMNVVETVTPFSAHTMDTTSHNFTFQTFTLGDGSGSSCLYDVAIINDTLAYAVGEIYRNDTTFNVARWNGQEWELMRIYFPTVCGSSSLTAYPAKAIFSFDDEIWISSSGDKIAILKNGIQVDKFCLPSEVSMSINKLWGSREAGLYAVGNNGLIAHRGTDGVWRKIESGTTIDIQDIWGSTNVINGEIEILAVASTVFEIPPGKRVLKIEGTKAVPVADYGLPWSLSGLWFSRNTFFIVGDGAYRCRNIGESWNQVSLIQKYKEAIRGQAINDIVIAGHFGLLLHFNGCNWKDYSQQIYMPNGSFFSISMRNDLLVAAGNVGGVNAVIAVGRR